MKKIKSKKSNLKNKIKDTWNDFVHNPFGVFIEFLRGIKLYLTTNVFFCLFVIFNVLNGVMV